MDAVADGKSALVVSPTHAEKDLVTSEIRRQLRERGLLGKNEREFVKLTNAHLTEAQRGDAANYAPGDVIQFHQNAKGFRRGQRIDVGAGAPPLEQSKRFSVFRAGTFELAPGDTVRITQNGYTKDGAHRLDNGSTYRVKRFDGEGNVVLENGWTVDSRFGHWTWGYASTSHGAQGRTVDRVFIGQSALSLPASSREQFYVSCSRGRESVTVYCDDKASLREAVAQSGERMTATELMNGRRRRMLAFERDAERDREHYETRRREVTHGRG